MEGIKPKDLKPGDLVISLMHLNIYRVLENEQNKEMITAKRIACVWPAQMHYSSDQLHYWSYLSVKILTPDLFLAFLANATKPEDFQFAS